jgi:dTDP-4-dehydrorhamnose 3,5-epimerase-like enzyme
MKIIKTDIPDVLIIEPKVFTDDWSYFNETFPNTVMAWFLSGWNRWLSGSKK